MSDSAEVRRQARKGLREIVSQEIERLLTPKVDRLVAATRQVVTQDKDVRIALQLFVLALTEQRTVDKRQLLRDFDRAIEKNGSADAVPSAAIMDIRTALAK
jgi:hypothetical protein